MTIYSLSVRVSTSARLDGLSLTSIEFGGVRFGLDLDACNLRVGLFSAFRNMSTMHLSKNAAYLSLKMLEKIVYIRVCVRVCVRACVRVRVVCACVYNVKSVAYYVNY